MRHTSLGFLLLALTGLGNTVHAGPTAETQRLRLATWNLEWLIAPEQFRALAETCVPRGASAGPRQRSIPCNVAADLERSREDFRALARYARRLDAEIIALQEVDGTAAARRVFPNHDFCFTARPGVQNNGFAIRKGIPHRCGKDLVELDLGGRVRRGAELILYPDEPREIRLLSIHLKSGCARRPLDDTRDACVTLARQVPILERWIDEQAAAGRHYGVLGDFNHDLLNMTGESSFWSDINDDDPPGAELINVAAGERFVNCAPGQNYGTYIDHVLLGRSLAASIVPGSFIRLTFSAKDAVDRKLADHCPVGIDLTLPARSP
jgi:endonuclease/exonuclease/phosphatase family metal-dependent hydrolase